MGSPNLQNLINNIRNEEDNIYNENMISKGNFESNQIKNLLKIKKTNYNLEFSNIEKSSKDKKSNFLNNSLENQTNFNFLNSSNRYLPIKDDVYINRPKTSRVRKQSMFEKKTNIIKKKGNRRKDAKSTKKIPKFKKNSYFTNKSQTKKK